ncbi:ABC transporter ATP-binding protein [Paenibacillus massiliensis]|uniref:ABC transporter ATP-binding protein n=1 Tax=Paenibacillus massiliensis TaxID=225917 RepID=UPI0003712CF5|nr:ABC transporter ATP-binding protein [Paenibacillus massiliensis]
MDKNEHAVDSQPTKMKQNGSTGKAPAMGNGNGAKVNNFKKAIGQLIAYSRAYVPMIILAMVLALVGSAFNVIGPDKLSDVTNLIQEGIATRVDIDAVQQIMLVLVMLYGLALIFNYVQGFITATIAQRISKKMREELSQKINRIPLKYFDGTSHGNVLSRVTNDVDTIGQTLNNSLGTLVSALATFVGALVMMLYTNWIMTVTGILATLLGFALMSLIMKHSQKYFVAQQAELGQINGHIEETYTGHNVVKVYNGEPAAKEAFHDINSRLYTNAWKSQFMSGLMMPVMMFIGNFGYVAVCVVGAVLVNQQVITLGTIVAFMVYIRLFTQPLSQLAQAATNLQSAAAASERVFEFLGEEELADERDKTLRLDTAKGDVEFKHVRFGYNADRMIIKDFSMKAEAGQKIAIVGPTGAGKTTLVNLLMRFYELNGGEIYIDGTPISQLTRDNIHQLFCMVLQDTWLFEGTIRDNIIFSKVNVSNEQVEAASRAVGLHSFIKTLPRGYDTVLDDKATLSAGQKQLITIARAMIEDAPMLILDEATSSVDTRTELLIQQAMDQLTVGKTSFVIAHRLSTIKNADVILVMKDGDIIEMGNHVELLAKGGFYADLYNSQFEQAS